MKVYVVTKARPMESEEYVTVKSSFKEAEKFIRKGFPNARKDDFDKSHVSYLCKGIFMLAGKADRVVDGQDLFLMFIREEGLD